METGNYELVVDDVLEDNAGNNLNKLFDTDLTKPSREAKKILQIIPNPIVLI
jgi:hypothetical protein